MRILIGGDMAPTATNEEYFKNSQMEKIIGKELLGILHDADYRIFNLEVPLTNQMSPLKKCGPHLIASTETIAGFAQISTDFLTLANNHIMDQGEQGLHSTVNLLKHYGIAYGGVGQAIKEAKIPFVFTLDSLKIGIYCCAEHEFSIANENCPGANPFDALDSLDQIMTLKEYCDYVICLYHGGKELYRYPSPYLRKVCRKIIDKGADLVVCQHSHCIGCEEKWNNGTIVYGQGNFLFDYRDNEYWNSSLLIAVNPEDSTIEYIPLRKNGNSVNVASGSDFNCIISDFWDRSEQIKQPGFVENEYTQFSKKMIYTYLSRDMLIFRSFLFQVFNKLFGNRIGSYIIRKRLDRCRMIYINQYECEAHRELIIKGLEDPGK